MKPLCQEFVQSLNAIPRNELVYIHKTLTAFLATSGGASASAEFVDDPEKLAVIDALVVVLKEHRLFKGSRQNLARTRAFQSAQVKLELVMEWASPVRDRVVRGTLYQIAFRCLYNYLIGGLPTRWHEEKKFLARHRGPVGVREMLIFLDYVPAVMEFTFPGYAKSGLLGLIPKSKARVGYNR
jgi:hypothetical protein